MSDKHTNDNELLNGIKEIVLIVLIFVLSFYALSVSNRSEGQLLPMIAGKGCAVVMTGSMEPTLPVDSLIFVSEANSYQADDIVVIQENYNLVVHRLLRFEDGYAITKGDANNTEDPPVPISSIKGKVIGHIPGVGIAVNFVKTPLGSLVMVCAVGFLAISAFKKDDEEDTEEESDEGAKTEDEHKTE